jgi:hypothetical protein
MAFDPLEYIRENTQQQAAFDPSAYISANAPQDIPTDEMLGTTIGQATPTRELTIGQKAVNVLGDIASMGGQKVYSEYATPEDIAYEKQSKLKAAVEVPYSVGGDLLAAISSGTGTALDYAMDGQVDKSFGERMATSSYRPEISEKGETYKQTVLENLGALGPFSGDLAAIQRLAPVQGAPSLSRQLPAINKAVETTAKTMTAGEKAVNKSIDLSKAAAANIYNKVNFQGNEKIAQFLMKSALKPTIAQHRSGAGQNATNYMLKNGLNPTENGVKFIEKDLTQLNKQVDNIINANKNKTIRKTHIFNNLDDVRNKFAQQVDNEADLKAFDGVINRFKSRFNNQNITIKSAHEMKKNTYKQINKKYGELSNAQVEAEKTIARLLKEEIERVTSTNGVNQIKNLNKQISETVDTLDVVTRRHFMDSNKDTFHGLALLTHDPMIGTIQHFQATGLAKSLLAKPFKYVADEAPISTAAKDIVRAPYLLTTKSSNVDKLRALGLLSPYAE